MAWEFGGIAASAASPLAASPHARRSREISASGCGYPKPAGWLPSSRVATPPGAPFAGDHATRTPLTQCPPARLWLNARRPASDSMPAGSPLTQCPPDRRWLDARRPASDSMPAGPPLTRCPPARLWLNARRIAADSMPAGSPLTHARRIGAVSCPLAAAIPSSLDRVHMSLPGVPCVCLVVPTGTF